MTLMYLPTILPTNILFLCIGNEGGLGSKVHFRGMIEVHCLAPWLRCNDGVSSQSHVDAFFSAAVTSLRVEHNHGQQGGALAGLAVVGIHIAIIETNRTSGNLVGVRVILAASRKDGEMSLVN